MGGFADRVRGEWRGATGEPIRAVVNIGIGGSDLGPAMAAQALRTFTDPDRTHRFVSNVDGADLHWALRDLDPATTLFVVASKTFTTQETLTNARRPGTWLTDELGETPSPATSSRCRPTPRRWPAFGIDTDNMFGFWDWVGGRYSLDSAIGLSLMLAIGPDGFDELLAGFRSVDEHLRTAPFERNLPVLMGLLGVWYTNFFGTATHAVLPYAQELARFPAYLQQLEMESNGKSVTVDGQPVRLATGPVVWGEPGTNGQHAFFQLLHQGTQLVPADFIGVTIPNHPLEHHHDLFMANLFAQTEALAIGRTAEEVRAKGCPRTSSPTRCSRATGPPPPCCSTNVPIHPRLARRPLRAQGVHPGDGLGHQRVRPVGCRAGQGAGRAHRPRARPRRPPSRGSRSFHHRPHRTLPPSVRREGRG
jgi:glucose-6-phosphate isomerase